MGVGLSVDRTDLVNERTLGDYDPQGFTCWAHWADMESKPCKARAFWRTPVVRGRWDGVAFCDAHFAMLPGQGAPRKTLTA